MEALPSAGWVWAAKECTPQSFTGFNAAMAGEVGVIRPAPQPLWFCPVRQRGTWKAFLQGAFTVVSDAVLVLLIAHRTAISSHSSLVPSPGPRGQLSRPQRPDPSTDRPQAVHDPVLALHQAPGPERIRWCEGRLDTLSQYTHCTHAAEPARLPDKRKWCQWKQACGEHQQYAQPPAVPPQLPFKGVFMATVFPMLT